MRERGHLDSLSAIALVKECSRPLETASRAALASKYAKLAKCSQDTALREILHLVERDILVRNPEGG